LQPGDFNFWRLNKIGMMQHHSLDHLKKAVRILIIDDNPSIHEDFRHILSKVQFKDEDQKEHPPFEIDSAFQGEEGLKLAQQAIHEGSPYSVAFVDVRMPPGWDGIETVDRIWKVCPDLQVVICTAYSDYSWDHLVKKLPLSDQLLILKKPFETIEVVQLANALSEKWRLLQRAKSTPLSALIENPAPYYSCFISYGHDDRTFARLLYDRLRRRGLHCWLDEHHLLPGDDLHDGIDRGIRLWDKVLLCASKSSLTSWWVDSEINRAFQKEAQIMNERGRKVLALIPLNLDGFLFSDDYQGGKKIEIKSRIAANFVGWEKDDSVFDRELEKVMQALQAGDAGREKPPLSRL
jgi:DNA-binding LytR/AlgR family response regulator